MTHPGRTTADGCHVCRTNCAEYGVPEGQRHCHGVASTPKSAAPAPKAQAPRAATPVAPGPRGRGATTIGLPIVTTDRSYPGEVLRVDYEGFTVWLDCEKRGAVAFRYNAQRDVGNHPRSSSFYIDSAVPARCQQTSADTYKGGGRVDRGHLVPANHLDASAVAIAQSNSMVNIMPQRANMNRGAWLATEVIIECFRDIEELLVLGGVIWGNDTSDDHFLRSHGVATPDAFWKVVLRKDRVMSWIVPNSDSATQSRVDDFIVSVADVERATGRDIREVPDWMKSEKPSPWYIPYGCDKG